MKAYVCVYRHLVGKKMPIGKGKLLERYLEEYPNSLYDWGDDPAFFCASKTKSAVTWGVCRRDVREHVVKGGVVIFFCAKQDVINHKSWKYYYVGFGVCGDMLRGRRERLRIWSEPKRYPFGAYFNILINKDDKHREYTGNHDDWQKRIKAPYIIFDQKRSSFILGEPLLVASFGEDDKVELWRENTEVDRLKEIVFTENVSRRSLRTTHPQMAHRHIRINDVDEEFEKELKQFTLKLKRR